MKNNRGFLLAESLVVSTFVLTVLIVLFIQFSNLTNNYKNSYNYNNVESIYNLGAVDQYIQNNQTEPLAKYLDDMQTPYLVIYDDAGCNQDIGLTDITFCENVVSEAGIKFLIYTSSDIGEIQSYVKNTEDSVLTQDFRDFISKVEAVTVQNKGRLFAQFADGTYATVVIDKTTRTYDSESEMKPTFTSTVDENGVVTVHITYPLGCGTKYTCSYQKNSSKETINVAYDDGNTVDVDFNKNGMVTANVYDGQKTVTNTYSVTDCVPINELVFWAQANNSSNSSTILKDKSNTNHNGTIVGATLKNGILEFDGVDDYVNLGFTSYDFKNSISYVMYVKIDNSAKKWINLFGNWEGAGGGIEVNESNKIWTAFHNGSSYVGLNNSSVLSNNTYYTIIATFDGSNIKIYLDGKLEGTKASTALKTSPVPIYIGANPPSSGSASNFAKMFLREAMIYDRALSESEVKTVTDNFKDKYE